MTGEFFGTFLIPSLVHQDPHYHRMPDATITRRIAHAIYQVVWTQGDDGSGMLNYANLVGFAIDDEIGNLYVPGQQTDLPASASRYAIGLAIAPIDNFITEFLPDVARRIHVRVVLVQRIINQVATTEQRRTVAGEPLCHSSDHAVDNSLAVRALRPATVRCPLIPVQPAIPPFAAPWLG